MLKRNCILDPVIDSGLLSKLVSSSHFWFQLNRAVHGEVYCQLQRIDHWLYVIVAQLLRRISSPVIELYLTVTVRSIFLNVTQTINGKFRSQVTLL